MLDTLKDRAARGSVAFTLVVPATPFRGGRPAALEQVDEAVALLSELGLEVDGSIGDGDPMVALVKEWDPKRHDEMILSTLPTGMSKWLGADLPRRIERRTGPPNLHQKELRFESARSADDDAVVGARLGVSPPQSRERRLELLDR